MTNIVNVLLLFKKHFKYRLFFPAQSTIAASVTRVGRTRAPTSTRTYPRYGRINFCRINGDRELAYIANSHFMGRITKRQFSVSPCICLRCYKKDKSVPRRKVNLWCSVPIFRRLSPVTSSPCTICTTNCSWWRMWASVGDDIPERSLGTFHKFNLKANCFIWSRPLKFSSEQIK